MLKVLVRLKMKNSKEKEAYIFISNMMILATPRNGISKMYSRLIEDKKHDKSKS